MEQQINFTPDFYIIPASVMINENLQALDAKVFGVIYWLDRMNPESDRGCFASNATIAKIVGSSVGGVQNSLARLKEEEQVSVEFDESGHRLAIRALTHMKSGGGVSSNDDGGGHETMTRKSNTKKEYLYKSISSISEEENAQIETLHKGFVKLYKLDPDAIPSQADFDKALKAYKLTDKRKQKAVVRLRDAGFEMCKSAIINSAKEPFNHGENDRGWELDLYEYLFRSYENVEKWANKKPRGD